MGRALARGRGAPEALRLASRYAARVVKDFGGSPPANATTSQDVYTPTPPSGRKRVRKTRLSIPVDRGALDG